MFATTVGALGYMKITKVGDGEFSPLSGLCFARTEISF